MKFLAYFLLVFTAATSFAQTTHTALSCSRADLAAKIAEVGVVEGDTVVVPAGIASDWTSGLTVTKPITIIGSGFSNNSNEAFPELYTWGTTFVDGTGSLTSMLAFNLPAGKFGRISQINFQGNNVNHSGEPGCIAVIGYGEYRIDHCKFTTPTTRNISLQQDARGVSDHCWHHNKDGWHAYHFKNGDTAPGSIYGNNAWNEPSTVGTADNWFVENCYFSSTSNHYVGLCDSWNGGKGVMRFNRSGNAYQVHYSNHGTESPGEYRSGRMLEIYKNVFPSVTTHSRVFEMRGGTGVHWGNTITMPATTSVSFNAYRNDGSNDFPHGPADGTFAWDVADLSDGAGTPGGAGDGVFETGTSVVSNCLNRAATVGATVTQAGTTITCSAPLFTSGMVGKVVAWTQSVPEGTTTPATITAFTDSTHVVCSATNRTRATPAAFVVGDAKTLNDPTRSWTSPQWVRYTVRTIKNFTGTSGTATTVTVAGAGWATNQWIGYTITRQSNNQKGSVASNTADTITLRSDFYRPSFASGALDFQLSRSGKIVSHTSTELTIASQHDSYLIFTDPTDFEIRRVTFTMDQPGAGVSNKLSPTSQPPHQNLNQGHTEPIYNWNNTINGALLSASSGNYCVGVDRDYFNGVSLSVQSTPTSPFNGTTGVGMGTIANRPTGSPTPLVTGVGYWATDEGEWDSTNGATPDGQLYVATGPTTWVLKYVPYTYPHPLTVISGGGPGEDVTSPTVTGGSISSSGLQLVVTFSEPPLHVNAAHYSLSGGHSLGTVSVVGNTATFPVTPVVTNSETLTLGYTSGAGRTDDAAGNLLATFSGMAVTNNSLEITPVPNRSGRKGRGVPSSVQGR